MFLVVLRVKVDERLELRFRELAMKRFKYTKGALSRALEEAIIKWISSVESEEFTILRGIPSRLLMVFCLIST